MVYMAPIPPSQSHRLHLLTVTADGRRVYWAAASSRYGTDREWMGLIYSVGLVAASLGWDAWACCPLSTGRCPLSTGRCISSV